MEVVQLVVNGLYNVKDAYFDEFKGYASSSSGNFCDNKKEKRPYFFAFKASNGIIWFIPLSTQVGKYEDKIQRYEEKGKECIFYCTGMIGKEKNAFLIGDMFPITEKYIKKEYFKFGSHYIVQNEYMLKEIHKKASRYLSLVKQGKLRPFVDILSIEQKLLSQNS